MGLTGLDIYKQLPKKNCGECGPPTCLAFAMALAAGKASLDACPHVSEEARENLAAASAPPIRLVKIGAGDGAVEIGDETVLFRHEKTFFHPTAVAVEVPDTMDESALAERAAAIGGIRLERVGQTYTVDLVAVRNDSGDPQKFAAAAGTAAAKSGLPLVLVTEDPEAAAAALAEVAASRPLLYAATPQNHERMAALAKEHDVPLAVRADGLDALADLVGQVTGAGVKDLVLDPGRRAPAELLADMTQIRRLAIKKRFRQFGLPTIAFATADDPPAEVVEAAQMVAKYVGIVVLKNAEPHTLMALFTWRMNVYTDPQKPIQVEAKAHEVGNVTGDSPVLVTSNFSLTYFSVEGEVEASKVPAYILAVDTDGTSVLTAWAGGKLTSETIAAFVKQCGIEDKVNHHELIIPGHVAVLSGKLQESSGWDVTVGPREAAGIPAFMRARGLTK